jgi:hypothetical protein
MQIVTDDVLGGEADGEGTQPEGGEERADVNADLAEYHEACHTTQMITETTCTMTPDSVPARSASCAGASLCTLGMRALIAFLMRRPSTARTIAAMMRMTTTRSALETMEARSKLKSKPGMCTSFFLHGR